MPADMKATIAEAFLSLLQYKDVDKITVKVLKPATSPDRPSTIISKILLMLLNGVSELQPHSFSQISMKPTARRTPAGSL